MGIQEDPYRTEEPGHMSEASLAEIQRELDGGACPPELREQFRNLLSEIRVLRAQLDVVRRASQAGRRRNASGDTTKM